jgi:transcriptional regulator NrdR family protein
MTVSGNNNGRTLDATRCPQCGGESKVIMSRLRGGRFLRRRECLVSSEHRWTTVEVVTEME